MKLGSFVSTTTKPLISPIPVANASVMRIAVQAFPCHFPTSSASTIAVTPVITPADRSNSPPINQQADRHGDDPDSARQTSHRLISSVVRAVW